MGIPSNDLNISQAGYVTFDGVATFAGRTFQAGSGISLTNANGVSGNTTIAVSGSAVGQTITGNDGNALSPSSGNWNIIGAPLANGTNASVTSGSGNTLTVTSINTAKWIVDPTANRGTHTTVQGAIDAASSGQTIFIRPGVYTENLTLKAGVNLCAYISDGLTPNVTIVGKCTFTAAGTVSISGVRLQTNSDFLLAVTGSAESIVNLDYCYLNCSNNTGISFTTSSSSAKITVSNSTGNIGTTGIALYSSSSAGTLTFSGCTFTNTGASTTASSCSAGVVNLDNITMASPLSYSSTGSGQIQQCQLDTSAQNATTLTTSNTANVNTTVSNYLSGTASAISIGAGSTVNGTGLGINSSNANTVTGAGTFASSPPFFISSTGVNATTLVHYPFGITGTWTPNLQINSSSTGITYTRQLGGYTRIGNLVFVWMDVLLSNKGASVGSVTISNLPFATSTNGFSQILPVNYFNSWTSAGYTSMFMLLAASSTVGTLAAAGSGVGATAVTNAQITNTFFFNCNGFYIVN